VVDFSQSIQALVHHFGQVLEQHKQQTEQAVERAHRTYRNLARAEREGIFSAYIGHLRWKLEAYRLALGAPVEDVDLPVSIHECVLGRWLDDGGLQQIPEQHRYTLNAAHERLHEYVERMVADARKGRPEEIAYYLSDLEAASDEITSILDMCLADRVGQMATEDPLTRLPNRRQFNLDCEHKLAYVSRTGTPLSLLLIDIDHFKRVNDNYGHSIGDELLQQIAGRMKNAIRTSDRIYRWGGEEFAVLAWPKDMKELEQVAERICLEVSMEPFDTSAGSIDVTASIGGALYDNVRHHTMEVLFQHADTNLNRAKEEGRNQVVLDGAACIVQ
jgi:diguanylate cyclase (GGDEF)-like protein